MRVLGRIAPEFAAFAASIISFQKGEGIFRFRNIPKAIMDLKELQVVCELVNYKNFSDAAYSLSYSPSVITKYVSRVEAELGLKLFIRGKKSGELMLTPEGTVLIKAMRRIDADYQHLIELARQLGDSHQSTIRIGSQSRLGNLKEQELIASFLSENMHLDMSIVKSYPKDMVLFLKIGKIDALFFSVQHQLDIHEYIKDILDESDVEVVHIGFDASMYLGVSEKWMPGVDSAPFSAFRDFTFALPVMDSQDISDVKAMSTFTNFAEESGFTLNPVFIDCHDSAVFKLATMKPIAVSTLNPTIKYDGIKFVRVEDWPGGTNLYFLYLKNNQKDTLRLLKKSVYDYLNRG